MHFSDINNGSGSKLGKIAIVTALHLAVGIVLVNNMNKVKPGPSDLPIIDVFLFRDKVVEPPPPPPEPPAKVQKAVTPPRPVIAPPPEVQVEQTSTEPTITATFDARPVIAEPGPVVAVEPHTPPAAASTGGAMRTAVLADAAGCAKPDYPARAARLGEVGTVALALLVGSDGRVADSRIQKSSGSRDLDRAAVAALSMCKFKPATNGGVAEQGWAQIAYVWTLD